MMWNNDGSGWGWILVAGLGMLACMAMMVMMMRHGMSGRSQSSMDTESSAENLLATRLASGDIDLDEYERRRAALRRTRSSTGLSTNAPPGDIRSPSAESGSMRARDGNNQSS